MRQHRLGLGLAINHPRPVVEPSAHLVQPTADPAHQAKTKPQQAANSTNRNTAAEKVPGSSAIESNESSNTIKTAMIGPKNRTTISNSSNSHKLRNGGSIVGERSPIAG
jgi:hypothetical protein